MKRLLVLACVLVAVNALHARDLACIEYTPMPEAMIVVDSPAGGVDGTAARLGLDHLITCVGNSLHIIDVSDPMAPVVLSTVADLPNMAAKGTPAVVGHHIYLPNDGVTVIDAADPANPIGAGQLGANARDLASEGSLLAIAVSDGSIKLYDATDPLSPSLLSTVGNGTRVEFQDGVLAVMSSGFELFDIADPAAPVQICSLEYETFQQGSGHNAYFVTTYVHDLEIVDDTVIVLTNHYQRWGSWIYGVDILNSYSRRRIDITNPAEPTETAQLSTGRDDLVWPFVEFNLTRVGDLLADGRALFDPRSPTLEPVAGLPTGEPVLGGVVDLGAGQVFVLSRDHMCYTELGNPPIENADHPFGMTSTFAEFTDAGAGPDFLAQIRGTETEFGDVWVDLLVYDRTNDLPVTSLDISNNPNGFMAVAGRRVASGGHIYEIDSDYAITDHDLDLGYGIATVAMSGEDRMAALEGAELHIVDLTDLGNAGDIGQCTMLGLGSSYPRDMVWHGHLMVVGSGEGVSLATVSPGGYPTAQGFLALADGVKWVAMADDQTVLALSGDELVRIDVSDPLHPGLLHSAPAGLLAGRPLVELGLAYVAHDGFVSLYDVVTLEPLGSIILSGDVMHLMHWGLGVVGAGADFREFVHVPLACELTPTGADDLPRAVRQINAAPNPFNPQTVLSYSLDRAGPASLCVYDLRGRCVRQLSRGQRPAGRHQVTWNGRDDAGRELPAGPYLLRLETAGGVETGKVVMVK